MTLTTHAVVGAAAMTATVSALGPTPAGLALGFAAGFASHFVIDAIPHWDEGGALLRSVKRDPDDSLGFDMRLDKDFLIDLLILGSDALLGLALSILIFYFWFFHIPPLIILIGVVAGQLPDALQFLYFKLRPKWLKPLQRFHHRIQTELKNPLAIGIEVGLVALIVGALRLFI